MLNIVVAGASGRMGKLIAELINVADDLRLAGEADIDRPLEGVIDAADVLIDFTRADAATRHVTLAAEHGTPVVVGTTGLDGEQRRHIRAAAQRIAVVHAPNMSLGVNVMFHLIDAAAAALGPEFGVEIRETHHTQKLDSPSGTAVRMRNIAAQQRSVAADTIPVHATREGDVVGDHTIFFTGPEEVLEIRHHAKARTLFARGAVTAARWIADKEAGLYDMSHVLNLTKG